VILRTLVFRKSWGGDLPNYSFSQSIGPSGTKDDVYNSKSWQINLRNVKNVI